MIYISINEEPVKEAVCETIKEEGKEKINNNLKMKKLNLTQRQNQNQEPNQILKSSKKQLNQ